MTGVGRLTQPKHGSATRLLANDIFMLFALGPPPGDTRSCESDIARGLSGRDFNRASSQNLTVVLLI